MTPEDMILVTAMWSIGIGALVVFSKIIDDINSGWEFLSAMFVLVIGAFFMMLGAGALIRIMTTGC